MKSMFLVLGGLALAASVPAAAHAADRNTPVSAAVPVMTTDGCIDGPCANRSVTDDEIVRNTDGVTRCRTGSAMRVGADGVYCEICVEPSGPYVTGQRVLLSTRIGPNGTGYRTIRETSGTIVIVRSGETVGVRYSIG